jgi:hypothetical protein
LGPVAAGSAPNIGRVPPPMEGIDARGAGTGTAFFLTVSPLLATDGKGARAGCAADVAIAGVAARAAGDPPGKLGPGPKGIVCRAVPLGATSGSAAGGATALPAGMVLRAETPRFAPVLRATAAGFDAPARGVVGRACAVAACKEVGLAAGPAARCAAVRGDASPVALAPSAALGVAATLGLEVAAADAVAPPATPTAAIEMTMGALQFRQGTLPPRLASARATSSPMATIVEQTLHRICIASRSPLSRPSRLLTLRPDADLTTLLRQTLGCAHTSTLHLGVGIVTESPKLAITSRPL